MSAGSAHVERTSTYALDGPRTREMDGVLDNSAEQTPGRAQSRGYQCGALWQLQPLFSASW